MNYALILAGLTTTFILSQIFVIINYSCMATTYALKNRKWILIFSFISLIASAVSYMLLSAWSGLAMVSVAILRNIIFLVQNKKENDKNITVADWIILGILTIIIVVLAIFTYEGFLSLFSVFATFLFTVSIWQKNIFVYNVLGIVVSILWIIYDLFVWSPFAIACEIILFVFMVTTLIIKIVKSVKKKHETLQINETVVNDKDNLEVIDE